MRRTLLLSAFAVLALLPFTADAATIQSGDLIKGSGSSVYYFGSDGKRYVFPNEKTYFTWYSNFDSVKTVTDLELATITIGGNVTYRPGTRMIKMESDPKVYAIAHGGVLRWVETETVASGLFGANWNTMIDDVSVALYVNYVLGSSINAASSFDRSAELASAVTINANKIVAVPTPTPTPTPTSTTPIRSGTLTHVPETTGVNKTITLIATADPSAGIQFVDIFFNGFLMHRCEYSPCGADVTMPSDRVTSVAVAEFIWSDATRFITTSTIDATSADPGVTLTITQPEIELGAQREIVMDVDSSFVANKIDIYLDGNDVRGCNSVQQCRYSSAETSAVGTIHTVYAIAKDANGFSRQTAMKTFIVVENAHPIVTVAVGKNLLYAGESVDTTVTASDDDGIAYTEIATDDGSFTKRCTSSTCTATITRLSAGSFRFIGRAADALGLVQSATSSVITVQ